MILLSGVIPISLYVTLEVIKVLQVSTASVQLLLRAQHVCVRRSACLSCARTYFCLRALMHVCAMQCMLVLNPDLLMYHRASDTPFRCHTTNLNEDLGKVRTCLI